MNDNCSVRTPRRVSYYGAWWLGGVLLALLLVIAGDWLSGVVQLFRSNRIHSKTDAQTTCMALYNALNQFHTECDYIPMPTSGVKGKDWDSDSSSEEGLIVILKGMDVGVSRKAIDFLGDIKDAKTENGRRLNGLVRTRETAALVDPWGSPYLIRLDGDGDGFLANPDVESPVTRIAKSALVWSAGKDGDSETWKDNIASWTTSP